MHVNYIKSMLRRLVGEKRHLRLRRARQEARQSQFHVERLEPRLVLSGMPLISEFMASNEMTLTDGDALFSDWIEIHNPTTEAIDLAGWHLTDNEGDLSKWTFPNLPQSILDPNDYLVVFASGQAVDNYVDPANNLHTNFKLSAGGEYLALSDASGVPPKVVPAL